MVELKHGAGLVVAGEIKDTFKSVDEAILSGARMCASVIEATQGTDIPAVQTQKLLRSITDGLSRVVDGRSEMVDALRQMIAIKDHSSLAPISYGCPIGWEELMTNKSKPVSHHEEA